MFYVILYGLYQNQLYIYCIHFFIFFIHNCITKYYWQNFTKPLTKVFRKTTNVEYADSSQLSHLTILTIFCIVEDNLLRLLL